MKHIETMACVGEGRERTRTGCEAAIEEIVEAVIELEERQRNFLKFRVRWVLGIDSITTEPVLKHIDSRSNSKLMVVIGVLNDIDVETFKALTGDSLMSLVDSGIALDLCDLS
jgi:hypothetical protein